MSHKFLIIPLILSVLLVTGCTTDNNILNMAKASPIVQDFLAEYPNAGINVQLLGESVVRNDSDFISQCGNINASQYYKVVLSDPDSGLRAFAFVDKVDGVVCAYKEGGQSPPSTGGGGGNGAQTNQSGSTGGGSGNGAQSNQTGGAGGGSSNATCSSDIDCGVSTTNRQCSGNYACVNTTSFTCNNPGTTDSFCASSGGGVCTLCTYGCQDGFCMNETNQTIECYSDSDCGTSNTTKYCSGSSACMNTTTYACSNPGTPESNCDVSGGGGCGSCPNGCEDGECLSADTTAPEITIVSPANGSTVTNSSVTISVNTNETASCKSKFSVHTGGSGSMTSWSVMGTSNGLSHTKTNTVGDGYRYTYYINCTDNSGNSKEINLLFDADLGVAPTVNITYPGNNSNVTFTPVGVSAITNEIATCEHKATVCIPPPSCNGTGTCGSQGCGGTGWGLMSITGTIAHSQLYNITNTYTYTVYVRCTDAHGHVSDTVSVHFTAAL
jgi:hypothetical protein